jgi:hypothetical protein
MNGINWEAVIAMCALTGLVGAVVRFTVRAALTEFKQELRKDFATREWATETDRRLTKLEQVQ